MKTLPVALAAVLLAAGCSPDPKPAAVAPTPANAPAPVAKPAPAAIDRSRIVPIIWTQGATRADSVFEPLNDELVVLYAVDTGKELRFLMKNELEPAGLKPGELRALGVANLRTLAPNIQLPKGAEYSLITAGGIYASSLLLAPQIWSGSTVKVDGDIVVAVPARNLLFVTGSRTPGGIAKVREVAARALRESPNRLTDTLFVLRDGKFEKLAP
jgi:uncharacterized protein YtpQ (UPF0354 family)